MTVSQKSRITMWPRFGIKVGNSTFCIAKADQVTANRNAEVIANKMGDRVSQACLLWDGSDNGIECGLTAKQKMSTRPKQAVANSFQLFLPAEELSETKVELARKVIPSDYDASSHTFQLKYSTNGASGDGESKESSLSLSAFQVHVHLFRAELELARQYQSDLDEKPIVVLSIPSYYPTLSWPQLAEAAEEAGFHVAQIITEPTAAVIAYGIGELNNSNTTKYVLTVKSGGIYSHFALYAVRDGLYTQLEAYGPFSVGGQQYTETLVQFICEEFQRKYKLDPHESRRSIAKIRNAAANCKHILTTRPSTQLYIDSLMDGVDFNAQMSRARFESLIQPVIAGFMQTLTECVNEALQKHIEIECINHIVLLGATMQIPKLQSAISSRFPDAEIHSSIAADEVVAMGCAQQATYLTNPLEQDLQGTTDCVCAEDELSIWHGEDESHAQVLVERGTLLPSTVQVKLKQNAVTENAETFWIRSGTQVIAVSLEGATPAEEGVYRIEADVSLSEDDSGTDVPVVRLRCL